MEGKRVKLSELLEISYYEFSDYMICVEVFHDGKDMGAFCTERSQFVDWEEDEVRRIVDNHVSNRIQARHFEKQDSKKRKRLSNGVELEYYSHSDDLRCINLFRGDTIIGSFCTDLSSFEEWKEDEQLLETFVKKRICN